MYTIIKIQNCPICQNKFSITTNNKAQKVCSIDCRTKGRVRGAYLECGTCKKKIYRKRKQLREKNFCSRICLANSRKKIRGLCIKCDNQLEKNQTKYCSHKCQHQTQKEEAVRKWVSGEWSGMAKNEISEIIRNWLFEKYERKCQKCNWAEINHKTKKVPVQINHIDGNWQNNRPENLEILCPNCHSLTDNFGALNKGNGRKYRYAFTTKKTT